MKSKKDFRSVDRHISYSITKLCLIFSGFLLYLPVTHAGSYKYEFSGVFGECDLLCEEAGFKALENTNFSGEVLLPSSVRNPSTAEHFITDIPAKSTRSLYTFPLEKAYIKFDTEVAQFNFDGSVPPTIMINDCVEPGDSCTNNENLVWVYARNESNFFAFYMYGFSFPVLPISSITPPYSPIPLKIPGKEQMQTAAMYASADIETLDNRASIAPSWLNYPEPPLQVTFTYLPDTESIPVMPLSALGILIIVIYGIYFVEQSRA